MAEKNFDPEFAALDTAVANLKTAAGKAKIVPAIVVTPADGFVVPVNETLQFHASGPCTWSAFGGAINRSGLLTAPATAGQIRVTAKLEGSGEIFTSVGQAVAASEAPAAYQPDPTKPGYQPNKVPPNAAPGSSLQDQKDSQAVADAQAKYNTDLSQGK